MIVQKLDPHSRERINKPFEITEAQFKIHKKAEKGKSIAYLLIEVKDKTQKKKKEKTNKIVEKKLDNETKKK